LGKTRRQKESGHGLTQINTATENTEGRNDTRAETEDRRRKTGDRRQKTGDRRQKTEDRRQKREERREKREERREINRRDRGDRGERMSK